MQIEIQARQFSLTDSIRKYVLERLGFALGRRHQSIESIQVKLSDINGPRGGKDKRCLVCVKLPRLKNVVIEYIESDLYVAIHHATERASHAVNRRLARQRNVARIPNLFDKRLSLETEAGEYI